MVSRAPGPPSYAACDHIVASKEGNAIEPIDTALEKLGLKWTIRVVVPGYPDAMRIARQSDLVAFVLWQWFDNRSRRHVGSCHFRTPGPNAGV